MTALEQRLNTASTITGADVQNLLEPVLGGNIVGSMKRLPGGANNLNVVLELSGMPFPLVLRIFLRDPAACRREVYALERLGGVVPVPEVLANNANAGASQHFILYRYIEGYTFQQIRSMGGGADIADAAYALGQSLASIQTIEPEPVSQRWLAPCPRLDRDRLDSPLLEERLGSESRQRLNALFLRWRDRLDHLAADRSLVHGDFNNRNAIFAKRHGRWQVAGIIDWEYASVGSSLWDAARFICYEQPSRPCREPFFSQGFRDGGGHLPDDWKDLSRVMNTLTAALSLGRADTREGFIPELCEIVIASLAA